VRTTAPVIIAITPVGSTDWIDQPHQHARQDVWILRLLVAETPPHLPATTNSAHPWVRGMLANSKDQWGSSARRLAQVPSYLRPRRSWCCPALMRARQIKLGRTAVAGVVGTEVPARYARDTPQTPAPWACAGGLTPPIAVPRWYRVSSRPHAGVDRVAVRPVRLVPWRADPLWTRWRAAPSEKETLLEFTQGCGEEKQAHWGTSALGP
jgi:hypothetical protein